MVLIAGKERRLPIYDSYARVTETEAADGMGILVAVIDVPAQWVMEAGRILPEPDKADEEAWFAELHASAESTHRTAG